MSPAECARDALEELLARHERATRPVLTDAQVAAEAQAWALLAIYERLSDLTLTAYTVQP